MMEIPLKMCRNGNVDHPVHSFAVRRRPVPVLGMLVVIALLFVLITPAIAQTSSITYQGELENSGMPINGTVDVQFIFFSDPNNNDDIAGPIASDDLQVNNGLFTAEIPVGPEVFVGQEVWLEVRVRDGDSSGGHTILAPRQKITGTPLALHALTVADDAVGSSQLADNSVGSLEIVSGAVGNSEIASSAVGASEIQDGSIDGEKLVPSFKHESGAEFRSFEIHNTLTSSGTAIQVVNEAQSAVYNWPAFIASAWGGEPAIWAESFGVSDGGYVFALQNNTWSDSPGGSYSYDTIFTVTGNGDVNIDGSFNSGGADFAEAIAATEGASRSPEPGDVMIIDIENERTVTISNASNSTLVAGVYSNDPGVLGRTDEHHLGLTDHIPLGIVGIVSSKVSAENGPVATGDLLVTATTPGHAMRAADPSPGSILGKALEPLNGDRGQILVLLSLQ